MRAAVRAVSERPRQRAAPRGWWRRWRKRLKLLQALAPWAPLLVLARFARPRRCGLSLRLGTGDAALTAQLLGLAWIGVGVGLHVLSRQRGPLAEVPDLDLRPVWDRAALEVKLRCIAASGLRDIMAVLLWIALARVLHWWQRLQRGVKRWTAIRSRA